MEGFKRSSHGHLGVYLAFRSIKLQNLTVVKSSREFVINMVFIRIFVVRFNNVVSRTSVICSNNECYA